MESKWLFFGYDTAFTIDESCKAKDFLGTRIKVGGAFIIGNTQM